MTEFLQEILGQPEAICATAAYYAPDRAGSKSLDDFATAARKAGSIVITGMGSSYFLSGTLRAFLSQNGIAATVINAGELLHYQLNVLADDTLLVAISQSGESFETVNVVRQMDQRGIKASIAVITNEPESTLGRRADILLPTMAGTEEKTSTKTFITGFQVIYMINKVLKGIAVPAGIWQTVAAQIEATLSKREHTCPAMLRALGDASYLQFIARGTSMASASQSALMAMEASHTPAQALAGGEFRHGPLEMVCQGFTAVVIAHSATPTFEQTHRLIDEIVSFGGRVLLISDRPDAVPPGDALTVIAAPAPDEDLFDITSIIPVQLAVEIWAREEKGIIPGEFTHGQKVTNIE